MTQRIGRSLAMLVALIVGRSEALAADPAPIAGTSTATGTVRLASGRIAHFAYHYDRNALADAVISGDAIVALTESGSLLRFDRATLELTREWFGPVAATCLNRGQDGDVLAGFADGRIARVDPATLEVSAIAQSSGKVQWVGSWTEGPGREAKPRFVAVVERISEVEDRGRKYTVRSSVVHDPASGRTSAIQPDGDEPLARRASAFLLDRKHRLWLGGDNGEWGGWCSHVDLDAGKLHSVPGLKIYDFSPKPAWLGVMGFAERPDGQVWAHGGTTHMGSTEGFIWRVDRGQAEELYRLDNYPDNLEAFQKKQREREAKGEKPDPEDAPEPDPLPTDRPYLPVTHIVGLPGNGGVLVVAFSDLYRTDAKLARWAKVHGLKIRYRWGRPDAVGAYPSVRAVLPIEAPGKPTSLLFATRVDGLIRLDDGRETSRARPGQLGVGQVERIAGSSEGVLMLGGPSEEGTWRYRNGAWEAVSFAPPFERAGPDEPDIGPEAWRESVVLVNRDGSIVTINESPTMPGTRTVARWRHDKAEVLGRETSMLNASACFLTPDGGIWNAGRAFTQVRGGPVSVALQRLADGRWIDAHVFDWPPGAGRAGWSGIGWGLRAVHDDGPPWILLDPTNELLLRLSYGPGFKDPRLSVVSTTEAGDRLEVRDAIPWKKGQILLATDRGPRTIAIEGSRVEEPAIETGGRSIARLARDGRGRLWLGGEGLAVLDGKTLQPLDELPAIGRAKVVTLAADPDHPDGAIAAIEGRGVVFVRVQG